MAYKKSNFRLENENLILELKHDDLLIRDKKGNFDFSAKEVCKKQNNTIDLERLNNLWFEFYYKFTPSITLEDLAKIKHELV